MREVYGYETKTTFPAVLQLFNAQLPAGSLPRAAGVVEGRRKPPLQSIPLPCGRTAPSCSGTAESRYPAGDHGGCQSAVGKFFVITNFILDFMRQ